MAILRDGGTDWDLLIAGFLPSAIPVDGGALSLANFWVALPRSHSCALEFGHVWTRLRIRFVASLGSGIVALSLMWALGRTWRRVITLVLELDIN